MGVVKVNGIRFEAPSSWSFHPFQGLILGRPDSKAIVVQISSAFKDDLGPSDGHDRCAAITREFVSAGDDLFAEVSDGAADDFIGGFSVRSGDRLTRAWYRCHQRKLIIATCAIPWNLKDTPELNQRLGEVDQMMRSASYEAV